MVQNGYPDYMREIVHTLEEGKNDGVPHVQAYIKLQRQQRLSFVRKLFPRGHFTPLTSDDYILNTKRYAQKLDGTAVSAAVHQFNDPTHTIESVIRRMVVKMMEDHSETNYLSDDQMDISIHRRIIEKEMVREDYKYAKIFVSATYERMWKQFGNEMFESIFRAHTHTHTQAEIFSREGGITHATRRDTQGGTQGPDGTGGAPEEDNSSQGDEDCERDTDEGHSEGSSHDASEGTDISE